MGVPEKYNIVDVYGLDEDALAYVPRPVFALVLLFPCSEKVQVLYIFGLIGFVQQTH